MKLRGVLAIGLSTMMALSLAGCGAPQESATNKKGAIAKEESATIKIGVIAPQTGNVSQYGIAAQNGIILAVEEINAAGGVDGKQVELIAYDNKGDVTESINLFKRLVESDKVVSLLGPIISSTSLGVAPLAEKAKIPMLTPTGTAVDITPGKEYVFRGCFLDSYQAEAAVKFAVENLGAKTAAVLYNTGDDYSVGIAEVFKAGVEAAGGQITNYEGYASDTKDFKSILTNVKANNPEVILIPDYYNNVGLIAGQIKEMGITATMLGCDGWDGVQKDYVDVVEGAYFVNHYSTNDPSEVVQNFISAYKEKYGETSSAFGALGYDTTKILLNAIDQADSTESAKIQAAIKATDLEGVTGKVTFDEDNNPQKSFSIIKIENGELKLETKIER